MTSVNLVRLAVMERVGFKCLAHLGALMNEQKRTGQVAGVLQAGTLVRATVDMRTVMYNTKLELLAAKVSTAFGRVSFDLNEWFKR